MLSYLHNIFDWNISEINDIQFIKYAVFPYRYFKTNSITSPSMTRAHGVTHDRAENSVSMKTFDTTNTCDTSRILRTWQECARVRITATAEKFRLEIGAEEGVNINYYRFSGNGCDRRRETDVERYAADRRSAIKPLSAVYRSDSVSRTTCRFQSQPRSRGITRCSRQMRRCIGE